MGVSTSNRARVVGIETTFKDLRGSTALLLPQRVALIGQGATASSYATTKAQYTSAFAVGTAYGFGTPVHLAAKELLPVNGDGIGSIPLTVYPLEDDVSGVASAGDVTPSGTVSKAGNFTVNINNIPSGVFAVAIGDAVADIVTAMVAAVSANVDMPMIPTDSTTTMDLESKWAGASANSLVVEIVGPTDTGVSFAITQPVSGATNPDVDDALDQIGNVWETMVLNCMEIADTASLTKYTTFGEARWGTLVKKPLIVFTGNTITAVATAVAVCDARPTDRINAQLVAPGSNDLPLVVAARQLARIVVQANENPPVDYGSLAATGLTPGDDGDQWPYTDRDIAIKAGSSSIKVVDGVIRLGDTVTFYHPTGNTIPEYQYVVDIVKLQNIIYNLDLIFNSVNWDGKALIPDTQSTTNKDARRPKDAVAAVAALVDSLALQAIISDPTAAKSSIVAAIDGSNPKRINIELTVKLSGNTNIISLDLFFGFNFGGI